MAIDSWYMNPIGVDPGAPGQSTIYTTWGAGGAGSAGGGGGTWGITGDNSPWFTYVVPAAPIEHMWTTVNIQGTFAVDVKDEVPEWDP